MPQLFHHATPNPASLKFTTDTGLFIESGLYSFNTAEEAKGHPLGSQLFALAGVANVFILPQFVTVTKATVADWDTLLPQVLAVLVSYFERPLTA